MQRIYRLFTERLLCQIFLREFMEKPFPHLNIWKLNIWKLNIEHLNIWKLNMHRLSLQMRPNSREGEFCVKIHENINKFAICALHIWPFLAICYKIHNPPKNIPTQFFLQRFLKNSTAKVWGKISKDALRISSWEWRCLENFLRMGKVLMLANLQSQVLT